MATTDLKIVLEAQANLAGFTSAQTAAGALGNQVLATQRQITGQIQAQSAAQANVIRQAQQQQGLFSRIASSFRGSLGLPAGGGVLGAVGGAAGAAAGGLLAGAAGMVVNAFTSAARAGLALADTLGDLSEQLGVTMEEVLKLRVGGASSGTSMQTLFMGLGTLRQQMGLAASGDADAKRLLETYGVRGDELKDGNILGVAKTIIESLGSGGIQGSDENAMQRLFGRGYRKTVTAMNALPGNLQVTGSDLEMAKIYAGASEFADIMRDQRRIKLAADPGLGKFLAVDSFLLWWEDFKRGLDAQYSAPDFTKSKRTAGAWRPGGKGAADWDWSAPASGEGARRGLFASASDYRLWLSQTQVSKAMLAELKEISGVLTRALATGIKWE